MTQALAGFNENGIILATDSRATLYTETGEQQFLNVEKLHPIGKRMAILSGGLGVSVPLSLALRHQLIRREGLLSLDELVAFSLDYLSQGYAQHLEQHGEAREGLRRIYFILAGVFTELPPPGYRLILLGSEEGVPPLRRMEVGNVIVMPRNLGMEIRLSRALSQTGPLDEVLRMSRDFLQKMASTEDVVGPPFFFATLTREAGYQEFQP
ncbi:MAG: hypothetical protein MUF52_00260 [Syntrophobacteraceae bacterium]|jgi:hypothetical protein|nr:hypothetical protein [Syntrophobacteraceae bacterium]